MKNGIKLELAVNKKTLREIGDIYAGADEKTLPEFITRVFTMGLAAYREKAGGKHESN